MYPKTAEERPIARRNAQIKYAICQLGGPISNLVKASPPINGRLGSQPMAPE